MDLGGVVFFGERQLPFGGYKDFADCVAQNSDKSDPKAYCGTIQAAAEKAAEADDLQRYGIVKTDDSQRLVFGWASVSKDRTGLLIEDHHKDIIEPDVLEKAAYDFVLYGGGANEMHRGPMKGQIIESFMVTPEKLHAMGLESKSAPQAAWWVGVKLEQDAYAKVKSGLYKMFSIKGQSAVEMVG